MCTELTDESFGNWRPTIPRDVGVQCVISQTCFGLRRFVRDAPEFDRKILTLTRDIVLNCVYDVDNECCRDGEGDQRAPAVHQRALITPELS
ncbi:hypothetical protein BW21_4979 [Burkholderia humptydooensis]|uniref:hypothetical protein n=1 Tax=Burkholderia humptydooensis TaxID=430531 RepID=UPI0005D7A039|nr:hypothetical protein [Burkholderia humptydooensis]AJY39402.1 hypothetical protein BW21_4979 [Burkholderia sp. 2002721687]